MINITIAINMKRETVLADEYSTVREVLESKHFDITKGLLHMDSAPINPGDLNKTFAELGYDGTPNKDRAFLSLVTKADNAM